MIGGIAQLGFQFGDEMTALLGRRTFQGTPSQDVVMGKMEGLKEMMSADKGFHTL